MTIPTAAAASGQEAAGEPSVIVEFVDVQRSLALFVRGLLGRGVPLHQAPVGLTRAFANEHGWFFPARYAMYAGALARDAQFAAAAHLAAHALFGRPRLERKGLRPIQIVLISLFEDARVERALCAQLPGLRALFARLHVARPSAYTTFPGLCARIARALFDDAYVDGHPLVEKSRSLASQHDGDVRRWGSLLGNDVGQSRLSFNAKDYAVEPPYRDDHRLLWEEPLDDAQPHVLEADLASEGARPDAGRENGQQRSEAVPRMQGETLETVSPEHVEAPAEEPLRSHRYPEYDYQLRLSRPTFCTVLEQSVPAPAWSAVADEGTRLRAVQLAKRLRVSALTTKRREQEGDQLDFAAALDAVIALRMGRTPDARAFTRVARTRQPLALVLLLDLSASTGDVLPGLGRTVLALARDASLLLCEVLARSGDRFAVHGFSSEGRHRVTYRRYKELDQPWTDRARAAVQQIAPLQSTRMGAAIRHAAHALRDAREAQRVVLLLTDGAPSDIDVVDPAYLVHDAQHAVGEARRRGVAVFAVSLDASADRYVGTIFGATRYVVLDHPEQLPNVLTRLYARLAG